MNKKPQLCIDLDNTVFDMSTPFNRDIKKQLKKLKREKNKYLTLYEKYYNDNAYFGEVHPYLSLISKLETFLETKTKLDLTKDEQVYFTYPHSRKNFFIYLKLIPGAKESIEKLKEFYEIDFVTKCSSWNPLSYTEKRLSIEYNFGFDMCEHLYLVPDKTRIIGDVLVDDNLWEGFTGSQLLFGSEGLETWEQVYDKLILTYKQFHEKI